VALLDSDVQQVKITISIAKNGERMPKVPNWDRFDEVSDSYDSQFITSREPARRLVSFSGIERNMTVLEFGCGTGFATRLASEVVGVNGSVLATDIATKMMAVAQRNIIASNVEFRVADAVTADLPLESFDVVFANCVLMGLDDVSGILRRWARLVRDEGFLAFSSFSREMQTPFSLVPEGFSVLQEYLGEMPNRFPETEIDNVDACANVLNAAGLTDVEVEEHDLGYCYPDFNSFWNEWWGSLFRLRLQALEPERLTSLKSALSTAMAPAFQDEGLYRPNITILAKGRRPG
jgi:ubiquinone/menaquinone biosynthesis C-methylase UbiE